MVSSIHRLSCFWLEPEYGAVSWNAAREFLGRVRSSKVGHARAEGHIYEHYNPQELPKAPGYQWLLDRLDELVKEMPSDPDQPPFDAAPVFDPRNPVPKRDPFPAFFWTMRSQDGRPWGILEVLIGRDFVLFHQSVMQSTENGLGIEPLRSLEETGWVMSHECTDALFTSVFTQVSALGEAEHEIIFAELKEDLTHHSDDFKFSGKGIDYQIRLSIRQILPATCQGQSASYKGLIFVEPILVHSIESQDFSACHLDATSFILYLATLLTNCSKIEFEQDLAETKFKNIEEGLGGELARIDRIHERQSCALPTRLPRSQVKRLRNSLHSAWQDLESAQQLVETCRLNFKQFEAFSRVLLHEHDPWVQETLGRLRQVGCDLRERRHALEHLSSWLRARIDFLVTTGGSFGGNYSLELLPSETARCARRSQEAEGLSPLIVESLVEEVPGKFATLWITGRAGQQQSQANAAGWLVLRPKEITPDRRDDMRDFYFEALGDCSADDLRILLESLCDPGGCLRLSTATLGKSTTLPIGLIFHRDDERKKGSRSYQEVEKEVIGFLKHALSPAYVANSPVKLKSEVENQDWTAIFCLRSFLDAVIRLLNRPPDHLAGVSSEFSIERSRLLFLSGFLQIVSGEGNAAMSSLREAARLSMADHELPWAYFVAQFFQAYRQLEVGVPESTRIAYLLQNRPKQAWRDQLALDFLDVYDLRSAIGLARAARRDPLRRPWSIRFWLWSLAFATGAILLGADHWLSVSTKGREVIFGLSSILAVLGAPLALWLGAHGALSRLFPKILYPRILGAVTIAAINFCATQETGTLASAGPLIFGILVMISLGVGELYMYSEVRRKVGDPKESLCRSLDVFSLAFLEAISLSTIFALVYERMFWTFAKEFERSSLGAYSVVGVFLRPRTIVLVAVLSMLIGIVVQLMFPSSGEGEKSSL